VVTVQCERGRHRFVPVAAFLLSRAGSTSETFLLRPRPRINAQITRKLSQIRPAHNAVCTACSFVPAARFDTGEFESIDNQKYRIPLAFAFP
jgi:hypothetical protein